MKYRTDLILQPWRGFLYIIFFHFPDSQISFLNGCIFIFDEATEKTENGKLIQDLLP